MSTHEDRGLGGPLVVVFGERAATMCLEHGLEHVVDASKVSNVLSPETGLPLEEVGEWRDYAILITRGDEQVRDDVAVRLGEEHCRWAYLPDDPEGLPNAIVQASRMWSDEISRLSDIPDPGPLRVYKTGLPMLDDHGFRLELPAFFPIVGPYGSGKSVLLRQLLVNLWLLHGWKFILTAFEERVKPRYHRDFRRHLIRKPMVDKKTGEYLWTPEDEAIADAEIERGMLFFQRPKNKLLDLEHLMKRLEFAVRVHGVKVIAIDPVNEIDHVVPKGENKTDYMGRFIMRLKQLASDYNLLVIVCAHPPKDGVEKRLSRTKLLTLNDAADTAHYGNKADFGWCVWRNLDGPTYLHGDKIKNKEDCGESFLAEMFLDPDLKCFNVTRMGYEILGGQDE